MIKISNNVSLDLTLNEQTSTTGRPIRLSGIAKNLQIAEKWVNKSFKNHWIYTFKYLDAYDEFVSFEFDYNNKFVGICRT